MSRITIQRHFWNPVYDRLARGYDVVDWLTGFTTQRLRLRLLPHLPPSGAHLLEIGYGSGMLHAALARRYRMSGLDRAPGMARQTRRRLDREGLCSDLCVGSVYTIPWPDNTFDCVLSTFAFSAFADAGQALDEMARVLKSVGRLIIVDAGRADNGNYFAAALARTWELMGDYMRDERPLLARRGFSVEREEYGPGGCVHLVVAKRRKTIIL